MDSVHEAAPLIARAIAEAASIPEGHVGLVVLPECGRCVWWTGRVAIGLRYVSPPRGGFCPGPSPAQDREART
jgi:hypothetical protein